MVSAKKVKKKFHACVPLIFSEQKDDRQTRDFAGGRLLGKGYSVGSVKKSHSNSRVCVSADGSRRVGGISGLSFRCVFVTVGASLLCVHLYSHP